MTKEQKELQELIKVAAHDGRNNFRLFCKFFLNKQFNKVSAKFHDDLFAICENEELRRNVIIAPREHAKSTIMSFAFPLWVICYGKYESMLLISLTGEFATKWVRKIKSELEENQLLVAAFGDLKTDKWTESNIKTTTGVEIEAKGAGQQLRGHHFKVVVCDDLEDKEMLRSDVQVEYFRDWFDSVLYNTVGFNDRLFYIGTVISENCFLLQLSKRANWKTWFYQAYVDGIEKPGHELWADMHPHEALQEKKLNNPYTFATEQMNNPMLSGDQRFKPEWFMYYDSLPQNLRVTVTIDPSGMGTNKRADKCGISVCGTSSDGRLFSLEAISKQLDPQQLVLELFRINKQYAPYRVGIESNAFQRVLKFYIDEKIKSERVHLPVFEMKTNNRQSKEDRILALVPFFAEKRIWLNRNQYDLIQQLKQFPMPQEHDDIMDALAYQMQMVQFMHGQFSLTPEEIQKRINQAEVARIFGEDPRQRERSVTGYRPKFTLGDN